MITEIVVLGGGYTGVWAARAAAGAGARVRLVAADPDHSFHGWTAEVITGHVRPERARVPLADLLPGVEIVLGRVESVSLTQQTVRVATDHGHRHLAYDELVVAVGSRDAVERVPGLAEHGWSLKNPNGLAALRHMLTTLPPDDRVVVAGGGLTGVEAATAIAQRRPDLQVTLAHSGEAALPMLRPRFERVADYALRQALAAGVEVLAGARLVTVSATGAELTGYGHVASEVVISTIGQTPVTLPGLDHLPTDEVGRLVTDPFLRLTEHVWAGGDVAAVPHPSGRGYCPANALWAIYQGKRIGANLVRTVAGRKPTPFRFPGLGQGASLGLGRGAAELYGVQLTGWPAWLARWVFFHWFMPSRRVALRNALEWFTGPQWQGRTHDDDRDHRGPHRSDRRDAVQRNRGDHRRADRGAGARPAGASRRRGDRRERPVGAARVH